MTEPSIISDRQQLALRTLARLSHVRHAAADVTGTRLILVAEADRTPNEVLEAAQALLTSEGLGEFTDQLLLSFLSEPQSSRARFIGLETDRPGVGEFHVTVGLEWRGDLYEGSADGESTGPGEMRACARATAHALEAIAGGTVKIELVALKSMRIFDRDFVTVLLRSDSMGAGSLIGAALVNESSWKAAAHAVLDATNRVFARLPPAA